MATTCFVKLLKTIKHSLGTSDACKGHTIEGILSLFNTFPKLGGVGWVNTKHSEQCLTCEAVSAWQTLSLLCCGPCAPASVSVFQGDRLFSDKLTTIEVLMSSRVNLIPILPHLDLNWGILSDFICQDALPATNKRTK